MREDDCPKHATPYTRRKEGSGDWRQRGREDSFYLDFSIYDFSVTRWLGFGLDGKNGRLILPEEHKKRSVSGSFVFKGEKKVTAPRCGEGERYLF